MPIYQCSAAAAIDVEAPGAPRVFVHGFTAANCARAGEHHRRPDTKNQEGSGR
jgi:hypothetical protein